MAISVEKSDEECENDGTKLSPLSSYFSGVVYHLETKCYSKSFLSSLDNLFWDIYLFIHLLSVFLFYFIYLFICKSVFKKRIMLNFVSEVQFLLKLEISFQQASYWLFVLFCWFFKQLLVFWKNLLYFQLFAPLLQPALILKTKVYFIHLYHYFIIDIHT